MKLDSLDKQILYQLSVDARQSYKCIAQNINSKKDTVAYRIKQLEEKGIITKYVPVFSLSKVGIYSHKIYLNLHGLSKEQEQQLLHSLQENPDVIWIAKCYGAWDLMIAMYEKNIVDFSIKKNKLLSEFSQYISSYDITHIEDALVFYRDYLLESPTRYRGEFVFGGSTEIMSLDEDEENIIQLIKNDGRFEYYKVANQLKMDARTLQQKIKNLQTKNILQGTTCFIDIKKLGFQLHKLCIYLNNHKQEHIDAFVNILKQHPCTIHLIKSLGSWELEIEIETNSLQEIYDYISYLKNSHSQMIKKIDLATITEELKLEFYPEK